MTIDFNYKDGLKCIEHKDNPEFLRYYKYWYIDNGGIDSDGNMIKDKIPDWKKRVDEEYKRDKEEWDNMSTFPPCMFGLKCPYLRSSDESEPICTHPYIHFGGNVWMDKTMDSGLRMLPSSQTFPMVDQMDPSECPLIEPGSRMEDMMEQTRL